MAGDRATAAAMAMGGPSRAAARLRAFLQLGAILDRVADQPIKQGPDPGRSGRGSVPPGTRKRRPGASITPIRRCLGW